MNSTEAEVVAATDSDSTGDSVELTVVMPCLNERRTLGACILKARQALSQLGVRGEIIVADNGSTDGSREEAARLGARVVPVATRGYGAALAGGIAAARGRYVLMADSDDSYDLSDLGRFLEKLREGYPLVMGNRFRGEIKPGAMPPLHRYFGNPLLTAIGRLFFKSPCGDFYCGQRAFLKSAVEGMELKATGMEFALEMVVKASMSGMRIAEVPVTLSPDGRDRPPHLRSWRDGWRSLRLFLAYSPRWLFLYPGLLLVAVGTLGGAWILAGPRSLFGARLDIHTLFYCAAAVNLGCQLVFFSAFGKLLAIMTGLHPRNPRIERLLTRGVVEKGLIAGAALTAAGLLGSAYAFATWADASFGDLDPFRMMRLIIPSVVAMTLGVQVVFASFYLSLIQMRPLKTSNDD